MQPAMMGNTFNNATHHDISAGENWQSLFFIKYLIMISTQKIWIQKSEIVKWWQSPVYTRFKVIIIYDHLQY